MKGDDEDDTNRGDGHSHTVGGAPSTGSGQPPSAGSSTSGSGQHPPLLSLTSVLLSGSAGSSSSSSGSAAGGSHSSAGRRGGRGSSSSAPHAAAVMSSERHERSLGSNAGPPRGAGAAVARWRMRERMKTVSVALVVCLNIGVDPPDAARPVHCARLECWLDPLACPAAKSLDNIGKALQAQYERWQNRARYKLCLDPTSDDVKKLCVGLRRTAKDERILFHYNGHGVPRPTNNGEIWVFNKNYTQYIPLSVYELQAWLGSPSIYVLDCSAAGLVLQWFHHFALQREKDLAKQAQQPAAASVPAADPAAAPAPFALRDCIVLAACGAAESLPYAPELPADVFTACLTTPVKMALRWYVSQTMLAGVTAELVDKLPGKLSDRKTPLGELNWIFTAITDTIAWHVLPAELFQRLFRQDLLVASLFRNFLLAERVLRAHNCSPVSFPRLPPTHQHPLWQAWDHTLDVYVAQLPSGLARDEPVPDSHTFRPAPFFAEQLTAFEVWLELAADTSSPQQAKRPPQQLPIVLQVLLSQTHRLRALVLLARFLDLGAWAVNLALSVGIFPYVLKLLQSSATELRQVLVFIWAKVVAHDRSCHADLLKDHGHAYFATVLATPDVPADQRVMSAFVLSVLCDQSRPGQLACLQLASPHVPVPLLPTLLQQLTDADALVRRWAALTLARLWDDCDEAKTAAVRERGPEKLCALLTDQVVEVRAAAFLALGTFVGAADRSEARLGLEINLGLTLYIGLLDGSPLVRRELVVALARLVAAQPERFGASAREALAAQSTESAGAALAAPQAPGTPGPTTGSAPASAIRKRAAPLAGSGRIPRLNTDELAAANAAAATSTSSAGEGVHSSLWKIVLQLASDPHPDVSALATQLVRRVHTQLGLEEASFNPRASPRGTPPSTLDPQGIKKSPSFASMIGKLKGSSSSAVAPAAATPAAGAGPTTAQGGLRSSSQNLLGLGAHKRQLSSSNLEATAAAPAASASVSSGTPPDERESGSGSDSPAQAGPALPTLERSGLYEWSCEFFARPHLTGPGDADETAPAHVDRVWREAREAAAVTEALAASRSGPPVRRLESQISILHNEAMTSVLRFAAAPQDPLLLVADDAGTVSLWNYEANSRVQALATRATARVSALHVLNGAEASPLVCTGTADGVVRVWRGALAAGSAELVTAWRALADVPVPRTRGAGLLLEPLPHEALLVAAGDAELLRVWDLERELALHNLPTASDACVTALAHPAAEPHPLLAAGFGDGAIRLYDSRAAARFACVATLHEHKAWLVNVATPRTPHLLVSGATSGEVRVWDLRKLACTAVLPNAGGLAALAVHECAPLLACGLLNQKIRVLSLAGEELSLIRYHEGFLGQRIGPVSCLAFHPHRPLLAAGATDSIVSVYGPAA